MRIHRRFAALAGLLASSPALATVPLPVPEPGVFELLAAGAIAGAIVWARNRRK
ncbi:MAG: hypothetical protein BroJett026_00080 [Betaproteobacteria bacterium]|nr:MAG: hypothetical protein BroJett026_00080 [Betaproteobacteria bacterium]